MMLKKVIVLIGILCFFLAPATYATIIDFDSTAAGVYASLDYDGVTFIGIDDTTESSPFIGLEVRDFSSFGAGNVLSTEYSDVHIIQATFDMVTDFVSIDNIINGTITSEQDVISLSAYDINGTLLGTVTNALGDATLSIAMAGISYVQFNDVAGTWGNGYVIDNFEFNETAPVPEPATMLLLGTGLIGLAVGGRKKLFKK